MRADSKTLPDHQPFPETTFAQEILVRVPDPQAGNQADRCDHHQVGEQDNPIKLRNLHGPSLYKLRTGVTRQARGLPLDQALPR